jgi:tetratricopeptide (TPR) repeat protein
MTSLLVLALATSLAQLSAAGMPLRPVPPQQAAPVTRQAAPAPAGHAEAYYLFLQGRHLEMSGDAEAAIKAYEEAARLDPKSAEIPAELAALYSRQNQASAAIASAEKALQLDPQNLEAHRVIGMVLAALSQGENPNAPITDQASAEYAVKAVPHLEAALTGPGVPDPGLLLTLSRLYMRMGKFDKALPVLTNLAEQYSGAPEVEALLAEAQAGAGHVDEAIKSLEDLVLDEPRFYPALADLYQRERRWKEAAGAYEKAIQRAPRDTDLRTNLAFVLLNLGEPAQFQRARDLLSTVLKENPHDARALYLLSQTERELDDLDGAETTARRLLAERPNNASAALVLAQIFEQRHDYQKVVSTLQPFAPAADSKPAARDDELVPLLLHLGAACQETGQFDAAIRSFEEAQKRAPGNAAVEAGLAQAHLGAHHFQRAAEVAHAAGERHPGDLRFAEIESDALRQSGQMERAVAVMREATARHANEPVAHIALAELLVNGGRADEALRVLREVQPRFPKDLSIEFEVGAVLERQKKYADAEQAFKLVLADDPLHAPALNYLGYMLADRGERLEESLKYIERALAVDPDNGAYLDSLGWAYFKLNKLDLAESNLKKAADQRRGDSAVQDHYAQVLFKLGRYPDAIAAWERALAGDGEQINRQEIQGRIRTAKEKAGRR